MPETKKTSKKTSKKVSKTAKSKKEPKLKIFCGISQPIPKGHRLGSMKECLEMKQVRYYGLKKMDSKLIESVIGSKNNTEELRARYSTLRVNFNKLKKEFQKTKNADTKKELLKKLEEMTKEIKSIETKLNKK